MQNKLDFFDMSVTYAAGYSKYYTTQSTADILRTVREAMKFSRIVSIVAYSPISKHELTVFTDVPDFSSIPSLKVSI